MSPCPAVEGVPCQTLTLALPMHHLALSADELTLSVCGAAAEDAALTLDFYDVRTFFNKASSYLNGYKKKNPPSRSSAVTPLTRALFYVSSTVQTGQASVRYL